ncbi:MAG: DUF4340 domain-containing protein [Planctomycetota bacterium]
MKPRTTIILLIVLVLAGSLLLLLPKGTPQRPTEEDKETKPLLESGQLGSTIAVLRIFASTDDRPDLVLVKKNARWWVSSPHLFPANRSMIDDLLSRLAEIKATPLDDDAKIGPDDEFFDRGIKLEYTDLPPVEISLGERSGAGRARVSLAFSDDAVETDDALHGYFDTFNPADFYAKQVDVPIMPEVDRIDFSTIEAESRLVQHEGEWFIGEVEDAERALAQDLPDAPGVSQLFTLFEVLELSEPQAAGTPLSAYGLEQPLASITIGPIRNAPAQADDTMTISLGVPADPEDTKRYVSVRYDEGTPQTVFTAPTQYALLIAQDAAKFRDPRILTTPISLISRILLFDERAEANSKLIKIDNELVVLVNEGSGPGQSLNSRLVTGVLTGLANTRAQDYVRLPTDASQLLMTIAISPKIGENDEVFEVWEDVSNETDKQTVLIRRDKEQLGIRVPREMITALLDPTTLLVEDGE